MQTSDFTFAKAILGLSRVNQSASSDQSALCVYNSGQDKVYILCWTILGLCAQRSIPRFAQTGSRFVHNHRSAKILIFAPLTQIDSNFGKSLRSCLDTTMVDGHCVMVEEVSLSC